MAAPLNIFSLIRASEIGVYIENVNGAVTDPYIGQTLFPTTRTSNLDLSYFKLSNGLPVASQPGTFDAKAPLIEKRGVEKVTEEIPFFRWADRVSEKDWREIRALLATGDANLEYVVSRLFDSYNELVEGHIVQMERMRFDLLTNAAIHIKANAENGRTVKYDYDFDQDGKWKKSNVKTLTGTAQWTKKNADTSTPLIDLIEVANAARKKGVVLARAYMNWSTFMGLSASKSIAQQYIPYAVNTAPALSAGKVSEVVSDATGLAVTIYDKMFKDENMKARSFIPDGDVVLVPSYAVGQSVFGVTPEEDELRGEPDADVAVLTSGITIMTYKEQHPVNICTVASMLGMPSFERQNDCYVLKVFGE
jgi:hypothetical protein